MNYKVPNFGRDHDINASQGSLSWAEKNLKHKWVVKEKKPDPTHPMDYKVPNFGVDHDILTTQANIASQEKILGKKFNVEQDDNGVWIVP